MYKIIFLDYSMQGMDGPEVAIQIAHIVQNANLQLPTICCCTAYEGESFKQKAFAAGMQYYLLKPVSSNQLSEVISLIGR